MPYRNFALAPAYLPTWAVTKVKMKKFPVLERTRFSTHYTDLRYILL